MKPEEILNNPFEVLNQRLSNIEKILSESAKPQPEKEPLSKYLTLEELRELHPIHPSRQTVYNWTHAKRIPYRKSGKTLIFVRSEIEKFIEETCK